MYTLQDRYIELTGWTENRAIEARMRNFWYRLHTEQDFTIVNEISSISKAAIERAAQLVYDSRDRHRYSTNDYIYLMGNFVRDYEALKPPEKIAKYIAKQVKDRFDFKLPATVKSRIGQILSETSTETLSMRFSMGCKGNAEDYYYDGSCYWGEYSRSRDYIESNKGGAIRVYGKRDEILGRAWFLPMSTRELDNGLILFNFYGNDIYARSYVWGDLIAETIQAKQHDLKLWFRESDYTKIYLNSATSTFIGNVIHRKRTPYEHEYVLEVPDAWGYDENRQLCDGCDEYVGRRIWVIGDRNVCQDCLDEDYTRLSQRNYNGWYPNDVVVYVGDDAYHEDNPNIRYVNGEWYLSEEVVTDNCLDYHLISEEGDTWARCEDGSIWPIDQLKFNKGVYTLL